jgi:hypothetical protein
LGILSGIDKAGPFDAIVNASLATGFMVLASLTTCVWLLVTCCSKNSIFYPFLWTALIALYGFSTQRYGPFNLTSGGASLRIVAPHAFYDFCLFVALALLVAQIVSVFSIGSSLDSSDTHLLRLILVLLWTLLAGFPLIGSAWHWVTVEQLGGIQALPLGQISAFGWFCALVGASVYGVGFVAFMRWRTKGDWAKKLQEELR